jgi:hypothetical protein
VEVRVSIFMRLLYGRLIKSGFALERHDMSFGSVILLTGDAYKGM